MELYEVPTYNNTTEFLMHLAIKRGKLKKGGIADLEAAAKSVLQVGWEERGGRGGGSYC